MKKITSLILCTSAFIGINSQAGVIGNSNSAASSASSSQQNANTNPMHCHTGQKETNNSVRHYETSQQSERTMLKLLVPARIDRFGRMN